jgi:hypothetical protein
MNGPKEKIRVLLENSMVHHHVPKEKIRVLLENSMVHHVLLCVLYIFYYTQRHQPVTAKGLGGITFKKLLHPFEAL